MEVRWFLDGEPRKSRGRGVLDPMRLELGNRAMEALRHETEAAVLSLERDFGHVRYLLAELRREHQRQLTRLLEVRMVRRWA